MARIQFSKEQFEKLQKSSPDELTSILLTKFDPNRPEQSREPKASRPKPSIITPEPEVKPKAPTLSKKERRKLLRKEKQRARYLENREKSIKNKENRRKVEENKLRRVREISKKSAERPAFNIYTYGFSSTVSYSQSSNTHNTRPIYSNFRNNEYDLDKDYEAHQVEFGHGRKKSQEWNRTRALELNNALRELREIRRNDPNSFDRQAMK